LIVNNLIFWQAFKPKYIQAKASRGLSRELNDKKKAEHLKMSFLRRNHHQNKELSNIYIFKMLCGKKSPANLTQRSQTHQLAGNGPALAVCSGFLPGKLSLKR
jgi:hypothetical protein